MKRLLSICLALCLVLAMTAAMAAPATKTVIAAADGRTVTVAAQDADLTEPIPPEENPWSGFDTSKPAHLVFYVVGSEGEDHQRVIDLVNQRMQQLINTTI